MRQRDMPVSRVVGKQIGMARRQAALTQAELAQRLGWPRDTLVHYEYGRRGITVDRLQQIAAALGVQMATLLFADPAVQTVVDRLAGDHELAAQVSFFIQTLDDENEHLSDAI